MLSKEHRLAKTTDIQKAFARGRGFFNPLFTVKYLPGPGRRFTVVVSTKVSKRAVKRNRIKRVAREFIRLRLEKFRPGDYAIMVKPQAAGKEAADWRKNLEELFKKARVLE
jgi:ribonuclease P protein component